MKFDILTLFPFAVKAIISESITGRALEKGLFQCNFINIRDFSLDKHKRVDDYPYGGGMGMVMGVKAVHEAWKSTFADERPYTIYMSPKGRVLNQEIALELSKKEHIVILCGHYEGVDQRIIEKIIDDEISIGDYVLTGGEIPAAALVDSVARLLPGVLSSEECFNEESHYNGLLEYPHYTRPDEYEDMRVPPVLLSGHHENINRWRRRLSVALTYIKRPDMLKKTALTKDDLSVIHKLKGKHRKTLKMKTIAEIEKLIT